jgi:putative spermidine/putrescine transport system ATP-binding protein
VTGRLQQGLVLQNLRRVYGATVAVDRVDLAVAEGELVALLGPSGCGKTTTLRMVAGFVAPSSGKILIGGADVTAAPPYGRDTAMVFQGYALFPHMTVAENVGFGLEMRSVPRADRQRRVIEALRLVRLEGLEERRPSQLSGGQQQRVALARALVVNPSVFLLDEPLSNLDARLRAEVRVEIRALQQRLGLTTLFVTHDQEEALTMSDRLVVMDRGRVRQSGTPQALYERPENLFVASFLGRCNVLRGQSELPGVFRASGAALPCESEGPRGPSALVVRPERVAILPPGAGALPGRIGMITYLGGMTDWHVQTDAGVILVTRPTPDGHDPLRLLAAGDVVGLDWAAGAGRLLPDDIEEKSDEA